MNNRRHLRTYREAAAECGVSLRTLYNWARAGKFQPEYVKARVYVWKRDIARLKKEAGK